MRKGAHLCLAFGVLALSSCVYVSTDRQIDYGLSHFQMGLYNQAIPPLVSAAESLEKTNPRDRRLPQVLIALGTMAQSMNEDARADDFFKRALHAADLISPEDLRQKRNARVCLGVFYLERHRVEAVSFLEQALTISQQDRKTILYANDLDNLGQAYALAGRHEEANAKSTEALAVLDALPPSDEVQRNRGVVLHSLGFSYMEQGRYAEGEKMFRDSLQVLEASSAKSRERWRIRSVLSSYAELLRRAGRPEEAREMDRRAETFR